MKSYDRMTQIIQLTKLFNNIFNYGALHHPNLFNCFIILLFLLFYWLFDLLIMNKFYYVCIANLLIYMFNSLIDDICFYGGLLAIYSRRGLFGGCIWRTINGNWGIYGINRNGSNQTLE